MEAMTIGSKQATDRIVGIVGGIGPESTIDYYRTMMATWRRLRPDGTYPRVIIDSVDGGTVIGWLGKGDYAAAGRAFGTAIGELAGAGCGAALIASNACHLAFDQIDPSPPIELIHIVDSALRAAVAAGHRRLGIIGTRYVMGARLYADRFEPAGIEIVAPAREEQDLVHDIYLGELLGGIVDAESRRRLIAVIAAMRDRHGIDGVVLGGTELSITLTEPAYAGVPVLDTSRIHAEAAVDWLLSVDKSRSTTGRLNE
jgi:aspartate racemase